MKRAAVPLTFIFVFLAASFLSVAKLASAAEAITENSWATKAPMNVARSGLGVAAVNGKVYAIGGSTESGWAPSIPPSTAYTFANTRGFVGTNEEYDPATDNWTEKAPMPTPRMAFAIATVQNKIYCIGGRTNAAGSVDGYTAANEAYDTATNTWETKAPLPTATAWIVGSVVENRIHLIANSQTHYVYDPANDSWTTKAPAPQTLFYYASAVLDKRIFIVNYNPLLVSYSSETDRWSLLAYPPSSQAGGAGGATTGAMSLKRVYIFGEKANLEQGENPGFVRIYNPANNGWTYGADSPTNRYCFGVAAVNDTFYVIGGHTYTFPGDFAPTAVNEQYTPLGYGTPDPSYVLETAPPKIKTLFPAAQTYNQSNVTSTFTVDKTANWTGYSLDGKENMTVTGNFTLTDLSNGPHTLTVYANDTYGNMGASEPVSFTVDVPEPFPVVPIAVGVTVVAVVIVAAGLLLYLRRRKRQVRVVEVG